LRARLGWTKRIEGRGETKFATVKETKRIEREEERNKLEGGSRK
jgi:hypothetical protein